MTTRSQLDTYLERVIDRVKHIQELNLSLDDALHEAMTESQNLLAVMAMYRHGLKSMEKQNGIRAF